jgi:hypothetical protein
MKSSATLPELIAQLAGRDEGHGNSSKKYAEMHLTFAVSVSKPPHPNSGGESATNAGRSKFL